MHSHQQWAEKGANLDAEKKKIISFPLEGDECLIALKERWLRVASKKGGAISLST